MADAMREDEPHSRQRRRWQGLARLAEALHVLKRALVGSSMPSRRLRHTRLPKVLALPVFASDALSSVAYATEGTLLVLLGASIAAWDLLTPIAIAIAGLLAITVLSYRLIVQAYSTSGGAYVVAKDNLGVLAGLTAAAALLADYVLTVAVSVSAGVEAITSAVPALLPYLLAISLGFVAVIALANLRGLREAGTLFAIPTYGFVLAMLTLVIGGLVACLGGCPRAVVVEPEPVGPVAALGLFVVLHAFSSGSTALSGIEAISNGVSAFREPRGRNAATTLLLLGLIAIPLFVGVSVLAYHVDARPSHSATVLSEIAQAVFGQSILFYVIQAFTFAILILAANTAFQGFPRLAALLGRDQYLPRQFEDLGDRLVHSNGIIVLAVAAAAAIWAFDADSDRLIQLYIVGVFAAFTLSQAGMVGYWLRRRREGGEEGPGWRRKAALNGSGAVAAGLVLAIVIATKFPEGAWMVMVAIPLLIAVLSGIHRHYLTVARRLRTGAVSAEPAGRNFVVLYVEDLDAATARAIGYLRHLRGEDFRAIHVPANRSADDLEKRWGRFCQTVELEFLPNHEPAAESVLEYVRGIDAAEGDFITVVIPELLAKPSLASALSHPTSFALKALLLEASQVVVTDVPFVEGPQALDAEHERLTPERSVAFVLVSHVDDASVRAVNYACRLGTGDTRALFFALNPEETEPVQAEWEERQLPIPLEVIDAPYRHLGDPLLEQLRNVTEDPDSIAAVVLPETIVKRRWHSFLHNQRALYLKWLLLFEPRVILSSVPYRLD